MYISLKINGVGNAWPVKLGQEHPFYSRQSAEELANASFSLVSCKTKTISKSSINWEVLIDAGHGTAQYLLKSFNRIPEAMVITHPHIDHISGIDWVVQSYYRVYKKKYPIYASRLCWQHTIQAFPQLKHMVDYKELIPGEEIHVTEANNLKLKSFPVFHGKSAMGAHMLAFTIPFNAKDNRKIIFTGDLLAAMFSAEDADYLINADHLITDANNRYPYPKSNHWSISGKFSDKTLSDAYLADVPLLKNFSFLVSSHLGPDLDEKSYQYFGLLNNSFPEFSFYNLLDFIRFFKVNNTYLIHYSGSEDEKYYHQKICTRKELQEWVKNEAKNQHITCNFIIPNTGCIYPLNFE